MVPAGGPGSERGPRGSSTGSAAALLDKWPFSACKVGTCCFPNYSPL